MKQQLNFFIMPAFFTHTPTHSSIVRASINAQKLANYSKPIGLIGEKVIDGNYISYGYDGESYYVGFGVLETLAFGRMEMTFDQAKSAFNAIEFYSLDINKWDFNSAKKALKQARKNKLSGDALMFFFGNLFKEFNRSL